MNLVFDLLNSRNPYAHGTKGPVSLQNLERWNESCKNIAEYIFALKDERGNYIRTDCRKTAVWCFTFSIRSIQSIVTELLKHTSRPYKHVLTYKLSQDNIELLFNKIRWHCGWNNNPNVLQFKYALHQIIIRTVLSPQRLVTVQILKIPCVKPMVCGIIHENQSMSLIQRKVVICMMNTQQQKYTDTH